MHFSFSKLFFVVMCVSFFAVPVHAATVAGLTMFAPGIDNGLVAHWTFDAQDLTTNVFDRMGIYSGMLLLGPTGNTATTTTAGPMGQALVFDGVSDGILILPVIDVAETYPFTYSLWFKRSGASISYLIDQSVYGVRVYMSGLGVVSYAVTGQSGTVALTSPARLDDGQWHNLVGVSRASNEHELYIDGVSVDTDTSSVTGINPIYSSYFGRTTAGGSYFNGALDDIRIYNRGFSLNDVQRLYILGKGMRIGVSSLVVGGAATKIGTTPVAPVGSPLATGLVGHWTFDGKHMYQNVADISGQANHGQLINQTPTTTVPGVLGQGLLFDGTNDYIVDTQTINTSLVTVSAWVNIQSTPAQKGHIVGFMNGIGSATHDKNLFIGTDGKVYFYVYDGGTKTTSAPTSVVPLNQWVHLVGTADGTTAKTYMNGVEVGSVSAGATYTSYNVPNIIIGGETGFVAVAGGYITQSVDDTRIYSRALSANDVQQLYRIGQPQSFSNRQVNSAPTPSDDGRFPYSGANFGGGDQSVQLYLNTWNDLNGDSVEYYFEWFANNSGCSGTPTGNSGWIVDPTVTGGLTTNITDGQTNSWRVKARDSYGKESAWNQCYSFSNTVISGSCPYVFGWDGEQFNFEIDIFGSGGLGYQKWGLSEFVQPAPNRTYILNNVVPKNGVFEWRIVGDLSEVDYFDYFRMYSFHVPENIDIIVEGPTLGSGLLATSTLHTVSTTPLLPVNAVRLDTNENVTDTLSARDSQKVILNEEQKEEYSYQYIEVDFGDISQYPTKKIIIGGSTTYPQTDEGIARKQQFGLEWGMYVQDTEGVWKKVPKELYRPTKPLSFDSLIAVDISNIFISENTKIRLEYLYKVYVDYVALDVTQDLPLVVAEEHSIIDSDLHDFGGWHDFDKDGNVPDYYDVDNLDADFEDFPGYYTRFGNVTELLEEKDDKFLIMAKGDEVTVKNAVPNTVVPPGYKRVYMLDVTGFYKALGKTMTGMTVEPLPFSGMSMFPYPANEHYPDDAEHQQYLTEWNTRYLSPDIPR